MMIRNSNFANSDLLKKVQLCQAQIVDTNGFNSGKINSLKNGKYIKNAIIQAIHIKIKSL